MKHLTFLLLLTVQVCARDAFDSYLFQEMPKNPVAWFTGPLLTPSGHVVPHGHQNYEPYILWTRTSNMYNDHWRPRSVKTFNDILLQPLMQFGVMPYTEFDIFPQFVYNESRGEHRWRVSDIPIALSFQLLYDHVDNWSPGIKLKFSANVPVGKYDNLKPSLFGTDIGGVGCWFPSIGIVFSRLFHLSHVHYISSRLFFNYAIGTPTNVRGRSVYGGVKETRGTVYPGNIFQILVGLEYSITQRWALALDIQYQHINRNRFSGHSPIGTKPVFPSRERFALAPALEYNWSSKIGIIAGPWFTVGGRNAHDFISYMLAVNIYH